MSKELKEIYNKSTHIERKKEIKLLKEEIKEGEKHLKMLKDNLNYLINLLK